MAVNKAGESNKNCVFKVWEIWVSICAGINRFFERLFYKWAGICGARPYVVMGISLFIILAFGAGFARFNLQSQAERLYFPENSQAKKDLDRSENSFPAKAKPEEFLITSNNGDSLLTPDAFKVLLDIHNGLLNAVPDLPSICIKVRPGSTIDDCLFIGPLEVFRYNESLMTSENVNSNNSLIVQAINNNRTLFKNGRPASIEFEKYFGNYKYDNETKTVQATALRMLYYVIFAETDEQYDEVAPIEKKMIDFFESRLSEIKQRGYKLEFLMGRSVDDNIAESSGGDISYVAIAFTLMCTFTTIVLSRFKDRVGGHFWVGMIGLLCIALGIGGGFGIVMAGGTYFVAFVGVLPFLVLGVGIDDMFIILGELDALDSNLRGIERLQVALGNVGASITMTTLTDLVAFAVSASTDFPAIRYFCIYASVSIFLSYMMVMTFLVAYISLDIKRIEAGKWDLAPCKKVEGYTPWMTSSETLSNKLMKAYGEILMKTPIRVIVTLVCLGLLAAGIYGVYQVEEVFDLRQLGTDGSTFISFLDAREDNYPIRSFVYVIQDDANYNYSNINNQREYSALDQIALTNSYLEPKTINWMSAFHRWSNNTFYSGNEFYDKLDLFLQANPMYFVDLKRNGKQIVASKIHFFDKSNADYTFSKDSMIQLREDLEKKSNVPNIYATAFRYFYNEQAAVVREDTIRNLLVCALAILVITTPYLVHPIVILLVFGGFIALVVELFGLMAAWSVPLNSISMITSIMAIGFAVDYSAHIAHAFMLSNANTPEARVIDALESIGASVFMGGATTFLGMLATALGQSEIFRIFFKMMFGIVVLGLLNGLLFLPVLLSLLCRTNLRISQNDNDNNSEKDTEKGEEAGLKAISPPISPNATNTPSPIKSDQSLVIENPSTLPKVDIGESRPPSLETSWNNEVKS